MRVKAPHSMRMCLTVQGVGHICCNCYCFCIKKCVSHVCPICNQNIATCSFLDFLKAGLHSLKVGLIKKSLLWMLLFQDCCNFV